MRDSTADDGRRLLDLVGGEGNVADVDTEVGVKTVLP